MFGVCFRHGMGVLSLLAIPRSILHLERLRGGEASMKNLLSGLEALLLGEEKIRRGYYDLLR